MMSPVQCTKEHVGSGADQHRGKRWELNWLFTFSKNAQAREGLKQIQFFASHSID